MSCATMPSSLKSLHHPFASAADGAASPNNSNCTTARLGATGLTGGKQSPDTTVGPTDSAGLNSDSDLSLLRYAESS